MATVQQVSQVLETATAFLTRGEHAHLECYVLEVSTDDGALHKKSQWVPISKDGVHLLNQWVLPTSATVEFESKDGRSTVGYMTLLAVTATEWTVISVVFAARSRSGDLSLPSDMNKAIACCWERYGKANRACNGIAMSQVFHPLCRLTYANKQQDGTVTIVSSEDFCTMVSNRYTLPLHAPYAKDKEESWVSSCDTLLGVSMVSPQLALVRLKVAHPPFLWTDLLVCAKLSNQDKASNSKSGKDHDGWWIVAKSSSSEHFEKN